MIFYHGVLSTRAPFPRDSQLSNRIGPDISSASQFLAVVPTNVMPLARKLLHRHAHTYMLGYPACMYSISEIESLAPGFTLLLASIFPSGVTCLEESQLLGTTRLNGQVADMLLGDGCRSLF